MPERKKGKHLTLEDRQEIQKGLREHRSFTEIAYLIGCSPDTVSKEIRRHRYLKKRESNGYLSTRITPNKCKFWADCKHRNVCGKKGSSKCRILCRDCLQCNKLCPHFVYSPCPVDHKAPYVCNNCSRSSKCLMDKYLYNASYADREYREELRRARQGVDLTKEEFNEMDELVTGLVRKGQPIAHIMRTHGDEIPVSSRTVYLYMEKGYLTAKRVDLRRAVRYKPRKRKSAGTKRNSPVRKDGRHYDDFRLLKEACPEQRVVEMDTVEGTKGGKVLQTLHFVEMGFMLAVLHDSKEMAGMAGALESIEEAVGLEKFREMFPLILTDNGSEFADPELFEKDADSNLRTSVYYCDPKQSQQKGSIEKNHEYIRYIIPKGHSFDALDQEKVNLMMNHINSTVRPRFESTPYEMAEEAFGREALEKLGMKPIARDDVHLTSDLIR